jgi:hypothetical protein
MFGQIALGQHPTPTGAQPSAFSSLAPVQAIMAEEPKARDADLRRLVESGGEDVATAALGALITVHAKDLEGLASKTSLHLSDLSMLKLVGAVKDSKDQPFRVAFARVCLRRALDSPGGPRSTEGHAAKPGLTGFAAMVLSESSDPNDRDLVRESVRVRPYEVGLWLALARMGLGSSDCEALARSVWQHGPGQTRIAAAAALSATDLTAREFLVKTITDFLSGIGQVDPATLISQFYSEPSRGGRDASLFMKFQTQLPAVVTLQYVQIPEAERLTFEFIDSPNVMVRGTLGLIAAKRWPERLTKTALAHEAERVDLLATIAVFHPEMLSAVRALVPAQELSLRLQKLKDGSSGILFPNAAFAGLVF